MSGSTSSRAWSSSERSRSIAIGCAGQCEADQIARPGRCSEWVPNADRRDELLDGENVFSLAEIHVLIEARRRRRNGVRPNSSLHYRALALETFVPHGGNIAPRASAPAARGARSPNPNVALEVAMH
jgi:hypothetical protein